EPTATSIKDCNYMAHRVRKSKEELHQMGFDPEVIETLSPASTDTDTGIIANARINNLSPMNVNDTLAVGDEKSDKVWLHEHYIRTSVVDGTYEILQVFTVHNQILEVNRVSEFPFETITPFPTPGSIWGESVYDITKDIQDLITSLIRGTIDNIQNANFRRYTAIKGAYDRQSLLNNRPGGVVEINTVGAVTPFDYHPLPSGITQLLEYIEGKKEERTGVSKVGQGLDPNVFKNDNSTATVNMVMTAAQNRLRMVARNVAHRGMMNLMLSIYNLVRMNGKDPIRIETAKGEITIDPRTLPPRNEMIVAVAVGDNERKERAANLQNVLMVMTQVPQMQQFLQPHNAYYMATQLMESVGIYDTENFITPLDQIPPPQPDPMQQLAMQQLQEQIKQVQAETQKTVADVQ
ncbi:MAG: portal protein, partial [Cetobacterium sp.]|uniref:portal protein n=1 Tax=Cetobacterium sp. TaxID=2071632 RepID=UPI003EE48538